MAPSKIVSTTLALAVAAIGAQAQSVAPACATELKRCEANEVCANCYKYTNIPRLEEPEATCDSLDLWYERIYFPEGCDYVTPNTLVSDYVYCLLDSYKVALDIRCPYPGGTFAPTSAPTSAPTMAPTMSPTMATPPPTKKPRGGKGGKGGKNKKNGGAKRLI